MDLRRQFGSNGFFQDTYKSTLRIEVTVWQQAAAFHPDALKTPWFRSTEAVKKPCIAKVLS